MNISKSQPSILWVQVLALAGLQAAITLTWLVYNLYLPNTFILSAHFLIILLTLAGFSLIMNGVFPLVLELIPQRWAGLGIGIYFSGFSLAMSLSGFVFPPTITSLIAGISSALAFLLASVCIMVGGKYSSEN